MNGSTPFSGARPTGTRLVGAVARSAPPSSDCFGPWGGQEPMSEAPQPTEPFAQQQVAKDRTGHPSPTPGKSIRGEVRACIG